LEVLGLCEWVLLCKAAVAVCAHPPVAFRCIAARLYARKRPVACDAGWIHASLELVMCILLLLLCQVPNMVVQVLLSHTRAIKKVYYANEHKKCQNDCLYAVLEQQRF
jgi:hypothetical protein